MKPVAILAIAAVSSLPLPAQAFTGERGNPVADIGNARFEVVAGGGTGPKTYWCAASQYARFLGLTSGDRIYLARGPGPSQTVPDRRAVQFTTDPQAAGVDPLDPQSGLSVDIPGDNLSVVQAQQYCTQGLRRS